MMLDILAAQRLYGTSTSSTLSGGQVFGFNCNIADASKVFFDFTQNIAPVVTLYDTGTGNTLDLSGFSAGSTVNLAQGGFSSANGQTNNIGIALGTVITTAIGGAGNDFFFVGGADGTQHFDGEGGVNFIGTSTAAGSGTVDVSMKDGTVTDGGTLDATFANVLGLQLGGGTSDVLGLATGTGLVYGGTGTLTFTGEGAIDYIQASTGTNTIIGGHGAEIVFSNGGIDNFQAGNGGSFLQAGQTTNSQDTLTGSTGNDYVYGGAGSTTLVGGSGTEFLSGGSGTNTLVGGSGLNVFNGGPGTDAFHGGSGTNLMFEATGTDTFNGGTGTDYIYGGSGTSTVTGGSGTDVLTTGAGNQHFIGGTGLNVFNDVAAHLTAGRLDQIDNFGGNTNVYMPGASQGSTHFVAENGGTAILTTVGSGKAEIFVSGTGTAAVMAHTHFSL
jgi:serralysin